MQYGNILQRIDLHVLKHMPDLAVLNIICLSTAAQLNMYYLCLCCHQLYMFAPVSTAQICPCQVCETSLQTQQTKVAKYIVLAIAKPQTRP